MDKEFRIKKNIVVLYHGNCRDGFSGAWAAWKKFKNRADYVPLYYGPKHKVMLPHGLNAKEVYLIDFSLRADGEMKKLISRNKKVIALDHHLDAKDFTAMAHDYVFDNDHSGAVIAWQYFHPNKKLPLFLRYVEDLDIWRKKLPNTFEISAYGDLLDYDFKAWGRLAKQVEKFQSRAKIIKLGSSILSFQNKKIEELVSKNAALVKFAGHKTLAVNSPNWASQIGSALCRMLPPIGIVWSQRGKIVLVSLRSDGTADVSKIAKRFGGGGHKAASGFSFPVGSKFPWRNL